MEEKDMDEAQRRAQRVRLILMDCDGVLTDGRIVLLPEAEDIKFFHSQDGQGMKLAALAGLHTGVITTRFSRVLERRAKEMRVHYLYQDAENKIEAYEAILRQEGISDEEVAYIGDDLPDLPVLQRVGLAMAVANAVAEVKAQAHVVMEKEGGRAGVREAVEFILKAQGKWDSIIASFKPPLKSLHPSLIQAKLDQFSKLSDQQLIDSLKPGQPHSLKVRPDGTIVEGHHRIKVLRDRGVDVDSLPREVVPKN